MNDVSQFRQILLPCSVLAFVGCLLSYLVYGNLKSTSTTRIERQIHDESVLNATSIIHEINFYLRSLKALKSFITVNGDINRDHFKGFTDTLISEHSAIQALEWIPIIPFSEKDQFEQAARQDGFSDFRITERERQGKMIPALKRDVYYPVYYINPLTGNEAAVGFDLGSNPARRIALEKAIKTRAATASAPITLVQETGEAKGILVFDPVYKWNTVNQEKGELLGFALLVLRVADVIKEASGDFDTVLALSIADATSPDNVEKIYQSDLYKEQPSQDAFSVSRPSQIVDRQWQLNFQATPAHIKTLAPHSLGSLLIGFALTSLTTLMFGFYLSRKFQATALLHEKKATSELEALVDTAVDAIISISSQGVIERFNAAAEGIFGYDKSEVIGKNIKMLMPDSYAKEHDGYLHQYQKTGDKKIIGIGRTVTGLRKDGTEFPMDLSVGELPSPLTGYVGIIRDVSDRLRYEQQRQEAIGELESLVDTAVDAIISITQDGLIERFNPAAQKIFGYEKEEVVGRNVKMLMPEDYAQHHDGYLHQYQTTGNKKIIGIGRTVTGRHRDGTEFPMDLSVGELPSPMTGYVGIIRDVSERFHYEQQILQHSRDLARSNEDLAQFAYVASHDLKAPLRGIDHLAGWIDEKVGHHMDEECRSYMDLLRGRINRLEALLSSLLEYSRIGRQETSIRNVDLNVILTEAIDLLKTDSFTISADEMPVIQASPTEMNLLFQNLISNAIKHHDRKSGTIEISFAEHPNGYEFAVHDDGPGIPDTMSEKVFAMFQTLKPRDQVEGSGMGLAFVKKIVERNNATIHVGKSKLERGAAFIIIWPLKGRR